MPIRPLTAMTAFLALSGSAFAADELPAPTAGDAEAFIAKVEAELLPLNEYANRVGIVPIDVEIGGAALLALSR